SRASECARTTGDPDWNAAPGFLETAICYGQRGDPQAAIGGLRENAAVARANGLAIAEGFALLALPFISGRLADAEVARQVCERAGAWFWLAALQEAAVHLLEGRRDVSGDIFRRIRREARQGIATLAAWVDAR